MKGANRIIGVGMCCLFFTGCAAKAPTESGQQIPAPQVKKTESAVSQTSSTVECCYIGVKDFEEMLDTADAIVCGTVKETWNKNDMTETTRFTVSKVYAGEAPDELIIYEMNDEFKLKMNTTYVLFLMGMPDAPDENVYATIGGPQGIFVLAKDASGLNADGSSSNGILENANFTETDMANDWFALQD